MKYENCLRCGRRLKSEESKELGFGKTCWAKYKAEDNFKQLFSMELSNNNEVQGDANKQ